PNLKKQNKIKKLMLEHYIDRSGDKNPFFGKQHSEKTKKTMSRNNWMKKHTGSLNPNWKGGCRKNERNDPAYHQWIKLVKKRDNNTCRINDEHCKGYNIVHHIFNWREYKKLRYEINNGITLCQAHHPLKRAKEKRLIPFFQGLVPVLNEVFCQQ
ncbi:hypothetical protein LCGC14_2367370, partial [marine sediment metagenome]